MAGITNMGIDCASRFSELTGAKLLSRNDATGDAEMPLDEEIASKCFQEMIETSAKIEIKKAAGGTANQVRPYQRCTLVCYTGGAKPWKVLGAKDVYRYTKDKSPQHALRPWECVGFSVRCDALEEYSCTDDELLAKVIKANKQQTCEIIKMSKRLAADYAQRSNAEEELERLLDKDE